jgi:hypothetical protein
MKYIFFITIIITVSACQNSFDKKVAKHIEEKCKNKSECIINMGDATNFEWDTMYVFHEQTTDEEFYRKFDFDLENDDCDRGRYRILFTLNNKLAYQAIEACDVEKTDWKIWFGDPNKQDAPLKFYKEKSSFFVQKDNSLGKTLYYLSPHRKESEN